MPGDHPRLGESSGGKSRLLVLSPALKRSKRQTKVVSTGTRDHVRGKLEIGWTVEGCVH